MKIFESHFWYNKSQRNGIFLLIIIVLLLQVVIFINPFENDKTVDLDTNDLIAFQSQIDSLKEIELENRKPKIYPFNPNFITDYKGEQLGMSLIEIDRLHQFRAKGKFVNSKAEFQNVTQVSDSLLNRIAPYFKFPDWVVKRQNNNQIESKIKGNVSNRIDPSVSTNDINKATLEDFQTIDGVSFNMAERIIKYRSKLQGFYFEDQLYEVWGLNKNTANKVLLKFKITSKPTITKVNINTASFKKVLKNPYIDFELCKKIFDYRDEVAELQVLTELKNIKGFPTDKYDRIVLYLLAE